MQEPEFDNWKDAWEYHAAESHRQQVEMGEDALIEQLIRGLTDGYFSSWSAIGDVGTVDKSAVPMFRFLLERNMDYLNRYHCADALAKILGMRTDDPIFEGIKFDHDGEHVRQGFLKQLWEIISKRLSRPVHDYAPVFNEQPEAWMETHRYALTLREGASLDNIKSAWLSIADDFRQRFPEVVATFLETSEGISVLLTGLPIRTEISCKIASKTVNGSIALINNTEYALSMIRSACYIDFFNDAVRRGLYDWYEPGYEPL